MRKILLIAVLTLMAVMSVMPFWSKAQLSHMSVTPGVTQNAKRDNIASFAEKAAAIAPVAHDQSGYWAQMTRNATVRNRAGGRVIKTLTEGQWFHVYNAAASAKVKHYSFRNGRFRVTWQQDHGPFGSAINYYTLRNLSGRRLKVKIALERIPDTHCKWVNKGKSVSWTVDGYRFAGEPQKVVGCN